MVAALIMGAAIRPQAIFVKLSLSFRDARKREPGMTSRNQITGFHGAGTTR
jgi:hypothetical protein